MPQDTESTRDLLLDCAERLFAEFGIEAVSPRRIALDAGQRNQSAIRYHFGSKEDLIAALYTARLETINEQRRDMLAWLEREGRLGDLRALLGAIVLPLVDTIERTPYGTHYVRFLAHLFADRQRRDRLLSRNREAAPLRRIYRLMRGLNPDLPDTVWAERLRLVVGGNINALADRERMRESSDPRWRALPTAAFVSNLIDSGLAVLTAPASFATLALIRRGARGKHQAEEKRHVANG